MNYGQFQERWEQEADKERAAYDARPVADLLAEVRVGKAGYHFQIWYSLGARATLAEAGALLFEILESDREYLVRYHCAAALIAIAGAAATGFKPVELSARGAQPVAQRLAELRQRIGL